MNADKTEFKCFKQDGVISTLNGKPLKLVDQFTYLGSNILLTESNIHVGKTAIDRFSIIWKFDLSDKIKRDFSLAVDISVLLYGCILYIVIYISDLSFHHQIIVFFPLFNH